MTHYAMPNQAMTLARPLKSRLPRCRWGAFGLASALLMSRIDAAVAFPLLDIENTGGVPQGSELAPRDALDLRHQLQLANGLSAPAGGGWTFVPRIDWQEELTDNALQAHSPRRADLVSFFSPGFSLAGELPRVRLSFDFAPTLSIYARTSNLNSLTEQLNGLANVTVVPDLAYVDIRALAGVQSLNGGIGGLGGVSGAGSATASQQGGIPNLAGNGQGLNRNNEVQTTSFGISPYLIRRFGDWGTGRLGYSMNVTESDTVKGFAASPIPSGGANAQTLVTNEQSAHFVSGDILQYFQDTFDASLRQSQTTTGAGVVDFQSGVAAQTTRHSSSTRAIISDQINYQLTRDISVFVRGGHEDIQYSGSNAPSIHDLTWNVGTTWTPNPDSQLTLGYGHENGFDSANVDGHYAVTARTVVSVSYGSTLGTQLESVQNQLNLATAGSNGSLVNGQTGGQLFGANNALGVQQGIFRTTTLTLGTQTVLDRDILSFNLLLTDQTSTSPINASTASSKSANMSWLHQMRPDMTVSATLSYGLQDQTTNATSFARPGSTTTIAASLAWQWRISDTLSTSLRYSYLDRQSPVSTFQIYQNVLILGISKTF